MRFTDPAYASVKKLVQIVLPGLSSLGFILGLILNVDMLVPIGFFSVITLFFGICLTISTKNYTASGSNYDGQLYVIVPEDGPKVFTLELNGDPEELAQQDTVTFKILPDRVQ